MRWTPSASRSAFPMCSAISSPKARSAPRSFRRLRAPSQTGDKRAAWRLASNVITVLLLISGAARRRRHRVCRAARRAVRRGISRRARKTRAHGSPHAHHVSVSRDGGHRRRDDGDAQRAASLFHPRAVAGDVQRRDDRLRDHRRAARAAPGNRAHRRDCCGNAHRRRWADPGAMAGAATRRISLSSRSSTRAIHGCARSAA